MQTLLKFKNFVDEICAETGRNYKSLVLEKYKYDEDIKYYLNFLYNPYITTGISDKKINKDFGIKPHSHSINQYSLHSLFEINIKNMLNYLIKHNTGTDETIKSAQGTLELIRYFSDDSVVTLCKKVITKNLQLGIDSKTINKVMSNLIPEFNVMLANKYFDKPEVVKGKTFVLTTKIDGMRCVMMKENGNVTFWSRQGQPIEGLVDLEEEAKKVFPDNVCFDGELIAKETSKEDTYKNTMKAARTKDTEKHNLKMMIFDYMPLEDFKLQHNEIRYWDRRLFLQKIWGNYYVDYKVMQCGGVGTIFSFRSGNITSYICKETFDYFEILPELYVGNDTTKIDEILKEQVANGEEGIMINIIDAPYEFKRTNNLLKVKLFNDADLECIGFEEGTNRNKDTLGALLLKYNDSIVKCGSGFSDVLRNEIWTHQDEWLGRTITVKYFEESYDSKTGLKSLRFPIYVDYRTDK